MATKPVSTSDGGRVSGWSFPFHDPVPSSVKTYADSFLKICTATRSFWRLSGIHMPNFYKNSFLQAKILRVVKLPELLKKLWNSETKYQFTFTSINLYFSAFEVREALNWIPGSEKPLTTVLGLASLEGFRNSFSTYMLLESQKESAVHESMDEFDNYCKNLSHAKYEVWQNGCSSAAALALGGMFILPTVHAFTTLYTCVKGVSSVSALYRSYGPDLSY